jgi:hypothetical protein
MKTSRRGAHHNSYTCSASIRFGSIFGFVRYVFGALNVVASGLAAS